MSNHFNGHIIHISKTFTMETTVCSFHSSNNVNTHS